jgi:type I restriction enzyme S subunit
MSATPQKADPQTRDVIADADLPEGWVLCELRHLSYLVTSGSRDWSKFYSDTGAYFVRSAEINDYTLRLTEAMRVALPAKTEGMRSLIEAGNILVTITGANVGKCAKVETRIPEAYVSQSVALVKLKDKRLAAVIYYALRAPNVGGTQLSEMAYGLGRPVLSLPQIKSINIPLPPLAEQPRIVVKIEELLQKVSAARARVARVPLILKRFRQSVLAAACSGRLTEDWRKQHPELEPAGELLERIEQGREEDRKKARKTSRPDSDINEGGDLPDLPQLWSWATINQLADVGGGIQKQPKRTPEHNAYAYLRVANVLRGKLDLAEVHKMELFEGELETYRLERNDLLVVEGNGSLSEIGRSAIWNGEIENCVHQNHIIRVRARICSPAYLNAYWNSPAGTARVAEVAVTTAGLYNLSTQKVGRMPVPVPPLEEQHEIVRRVEALFKLADAIEKRVEAATKRADKLTQAILAKAFRGELVPTEAELARREGRPYETASVLLERIRREREAKSGDKAKVNPRRKARNVSPRA